MPELRTVAVETASDAELIRLVLRNDEAAARALMQRYNRRLYRVARGVVRDDGEAEDVRQEAYLRAFSALADFRGESSLSTWLTRIVLNEALQRLRCRCGSRQCAPWLEKAMLPPYLSTCPGALPKSEME